MYFIQLAEVAPLMNLDVTMVIVSPSRGNVMAITTVGIIQMRVVVRWVGLGRGEGVGLVTL